VFEETVYEVIAEPPLLAGGVNDTVACPFPTVAVPIIGALGTVAGTTELLVADAVLVPTALVAVTVNVYVVPFVRPVMTIGDEPPVAVAPVFDVTVYPVIAEPPLLTGGVKVTVAWPLPATALMLVGDPGALSGVTELLADEGVLVPIAFVAVTVNVYVVPFVRPVTTSGDAPPVAVKPPVFELTVYDVIAEPPLLAGGVNDTVAWPLPATALMLVGASGTVAGVTRFEALDGLLVPRAFVAVTVKL
jgi:hypothetical protein